MPDTATTVRPWTYGKNSREGGRPTQEDRCETMEFRTADDQEALLALAADGIGGRNSGELASQWAKEMIPAYLSSQSPTTSEIPQILVEAFEAAHARIYNDVMDHPNRAGMGTTCTAVVIVGRRLYLAHVGDSRAYVIRGNQIHQLSIDHTWAEEAIQAGRSPEEIRNHPNRGVIKRYLGINEEVDVDTRYRAFGDGSVRDSATQPFFLEDGDRILLCTDGVSDVVSDAQLLDVVRRNPAAEDRAATAVVQAALKANAKDNVTAVVVDLPGAAVVARRLPIWAIGGAVVLLLIAVGVGATLALSRPAATPTPARAANTPAATSVLAISPLATATRPAVVAATTSASIAAHTPVDAHTAAATPAVLADGPTYTPMPTFTVEPTFVPAPAAPPSAPTARRTDVPTVSSRTYASPTLLEPPNGDSRNGSVTFKWRPNGPLPDGAGYEVVWWPASAADPNTAAGFAPPVTATEQSIKLDAVGSSQIIRWTVLVVNKQPYERLTSPSQSDYRELVYSPQSGGGGGGGGGEIGKPPG